MVLYSLSFGVRCFHKWQQVLLTMQYLVRRQRQRVSNLVCEVCGQLKEVVALSLHEFGGRADYACGNSCDDRVAGRILCDDSASADNRVFSDCDSGQDDCSVAYVNRSPIFTGATLYRPV